MLIACDHMGKKAHDLNVRKIMQKTNESWKKKKKTITWAYKTTFTTHVQHKNV